MERKWHVEHADGSEWTLSDLEDWAFSAGEGLISLGMDGFYLDQFCNLVVLDECGNCCHVPESDDMRVVWD